MTVSVQDPIVRATANGVTTVFPYSFTLLAALDLVVSIDGAQITSGFTVSGVGNPSGGDVTFTTAPAAGAIVTLERILPLSREIDYQQNGDFRSPVVNLDLDRLWMALQQIVSSVSRTLRLPSTTDLTDYEVAGTATAAARANQVIGFDAAGNPTLFPPVDNTLLGIDLANSVDPLKGVTLIGGAGRVVSSIAALRALPKTGSKNVLVTGYYAAGDGGGGHYYLDAADTTTADNGGTVIVATDGGRWKLAYVGWISVKQFGAKGDGAANDTASIQAAINWARPTGLALYLPRGVYEISGSGLTISNTGAGSTGGTQSINFRTQLFGDGAGASVLSYTGTGACLTIITGGDSRSEFRGFSVLQKGAVKQGVGIALKETSYLAFDGVTVEGFEFGWDCTDNFTIKFIKCRAALNKTGLRAVRATISDPNDFSFVSCNFRNNTEFGAILNNPCELVFTGGSFEGNGSGVNGQGALKVNGGPKEGIVGLNLYGVYFEGNKGSFDLGIYDIGGTPGIHNISGSTFNRVSNAEFTSANVALFKTTAAQTKIKIDGNGFSGFNTYLADPSRKYVQVVNPLDNNYLVDIGTNIWGSTVERPDLPGAFGTNSRVAAAVRFNGATATITGARHNVALIVRNGVGDYTVNYEKALRNTANVYSIGVAEVSSFSEIFSETTASINFKMRNAAGALADFANISFIAYGFDGAE